MDVARMQAHCLAKPGAWPDNPWDHEHPVVKVHDKIFAFLGAGAVGVKAAASREVADEWPQRYPDESYRLVVTKLPRKHRHEGWDG